MCRGNADSLSSARRLPRRLTRLRHREGKEGVPATFRGHLAAFKLAPGFTGRLELGLYAKEFDAGTWLGNADSFDYIVFAKTCAWLAEAPARPPVLYSVGRAVYKVM